MKTDHKDGMYVVCGGSDQYWTRTNAKTLRGAKILASKIYQIAVGGKIEVAQVRNGHYVPCAIKRGYGEWQ